MKTRRIWEEFQRTRRLDVEDYEALILADVNLREEIRQRAKSIRDQVFGKGVFIRGLIEVSNICANDCYYCGIRRSNSSVSRYRLDYEEIFSRAKLGVSLGFRTFVLQGGETHPLDVDGFSALLRRMKKELGDVAITLSLGEHEEEVYRTLFEAGADRYLLRHETANPTHYARLHPETMTLEHRMACLESLKKIGYQVGCGWMVGSPHQTSEDLARDLKFAEELQPHMCGIGPFLPQQDTPFRDESPGDVEMVCHLLSLLRVGHPKLLLPATTALGTAKEGGRERGILCGANVIMPNLSPPQVRADYRLYDNKLATGLESAENVRQLNEQLGKIGYHIAMGRGDAPGWRKKE